MVLFRPRWLYIFRPALVAGEPLWFFLGLGGYIFSDLGGRVFGLGEPFSP